MAYHWQDALAVGPFALYLFVLGVWHGGWHPRVVSGEADSALLAFGLGGVIVFGPFGRILATILFGKPTAASWLAMASGLALLTTLVARRAAGRLVVYHVDPDTLDRMVRETLDPDQFARTVRGFENPETKRGVSIDASPRTRTATLEAFGDEPEPLIQGLAAGLASRAKEVVVRPSRFAWLFLASSAMTLVVPMVGWGLAESRVRDALRLLLHKLSVG